MKIPSKNKKHKNKKKKEQLVVIVEKCEEMKRILFFSEKRI